jgi:4-alpha-glucanotransferase
MTRKLRRQGIFVTSTRKQPPERSAGILLHPTSLPGPYGVGDLGPAAYAWVDDLVRARQTWWQVLPLGPTGYGDSPYQCFSAFAGNLNLISPDLLIKDGLLRQTDVSGVSFPADRVAYGRVIQFKVGLLGRAWEDFQAGSAAELRLPFEKFCQEQTGWLDDFALFMALKESHGGKSWLQWPAELVLRKAGALKQAKKDLADAIGRHKFGQFLFFRQWTALKDYVNGKGIGLIGDLPIFVSSDSADVWANPNLFLLDRQRRPKVVAGVPPDYFSATGQLWGNPLYDWAVLQETAYAWWIARLRATLAQVDLVRLDHFRGFEAYWEVPAGNSTAEIGRWVPGPGADLFKALRRALGRLPLIAEDLGVITPPVEALRRQFHLPGMRILQFGFGGAFEERFLPHAYDRNTVVYTGTHDNDTTRGWYANLTDKERNFLHRYVPHVAEDVPWELIRVAWASVADYALAPLQDVLNLGSEARMNRPGQASGNWRWRFTTDRLTADVVDRLADLTAVYVRYGRDLGNALC